MDLSSNFLLDKTLVGGRPANRAIWYISSLMPTTTTAHPYTHSFPVRTPVELTNPVKNWRYFRVRRYFGYGGSAGVLNCPMFSISLPSKTSRIDFLGNNGNVTSQYCTCLIQSSSNSGMPSPWFAIETDRIPGNLTLQFSSIPGFSAISQAYNWIIELEWIDGEPLSE